MSQKEQLLEIYKLTVEMSDRLSARRALANTFFLTMESTLLTVLGVWIGNGEKVSIRTASALAVVSVLIASLWWLQISSYRNINEAKFKVIHKIEKDLVFAPYTIEWDLIRAARKRHKDLTKTERYIPFAFLAIDLLLILSAMKQ